MRNTDYTLAEFEEQEERSTVVSVLLSLLILAICVFFIYFSYTASAAYAGDCLTYGEDFYNITSISIVPVNGTPAIESTEEWYSDQCEFEVIEGTLVMIGDTITDTPVIICTHPQLAPGTYNISIKGYTAFYKEETRHYRSSGGGGGGDCSDRDGDGIPDNIEWSMCTDWTNPDTDDDGINDFEETVAGEDGWITDPCDADTDGDGVLDGDDPCPTDSTDACVGSGGAVTQTPTMTPTATETPIATETTPDEPSDITWMLFGGISLLCVLIIVFAEWYKRRLSKKE